MTIVVSEAVYEDSCMLEIVLTGLVWDGDTFEDVVSGDPQYLS